MDIREKLRQIESLQLKPERTPTFRSSSPVAEFEIGRVIDGFMKPTPHGAFFCHQKDFPPDHQHGEIAIASLLSKPSTLLSIVGQNQIFENIGLSKILFLDTETTGISGGTGMYAFLVGLGYFTETGFRVEQFFLDDIKDELPLLHEINQLLERHELLVTYNGKSFDAPLLETRNIYHRLSTLLNSRPHLDLLHSARRLWKSILPDCALTTVEASVLKHQRVGDIPSYLIPHIYFDYVHDRDARPLRPVFYHNQQDILAMAAIMVKFLAILECPLHETVSAPEILALARIYENMAQLERASELYAHLLEHHFEKKYRRQSLFRAALIYKRLEKWAEAAEAWEAYLNSEPYHPLPYVELAKYYEHRMGEFVKAKSLVEKALSELNVMEGIGRRTEWLVYKNDLEYRRNRLIRKINAAASVSNQPKVEFHETRFEESPR